MTKNQLIREDCVCADHTSSIRYALVLPKRECRTGLGGGGIGCGTVRRLLLPYIITPGEERLGLAGCLEFNRSIVGDGWSSLGRDNPLNVAKLHRQPRRSDPHKDRRLDRLACSRFYRTSLGNDGPPIDASGDGCEKPSARGKRGLVPSTLTRHQDAPRTLPGMFMGPSRRQVSLLVLTAIWHVRWILSASALIS
jgi:hypothetical protein